MELPWEERRLKIVLKDIVRSSTFGVMVIQDRADEQLIFTASQL